MTKLVIFRFLLTVLSFACVLQTQICFGQATSLKNHQSSFNEEDYISQKEVILEKSYHGLIRENESLVELTPILKVDEEKICGFRIVKNLFHDIPFQIDLINNLGIIRATHSLNCEKRKSYSFEIIAVFCDGTHSAGANVHITIVDVNEYAPEFSQPSYVTEVEEGRLYKEIIKVQAVDKDCTPLFGDVCKYELLNEDQPFEIDKDGSIKNVEPLSHKLSHNHILSVVAYDCAYKASKPVMVNIKVRRVCEPKYVGIPERIDYSSSSNDSIFLFPKIQLEFCDASCFKETENILVTVALKTKHISYGCDRDQRNCFARKPLIDLLPRDAEWTKYLKKDEGPEPIFHFDGFSGVLIPDKKIAHHDFSTGSFSIVTIFRHSDSAATNKHTKEHIICSADDHKMNRHHMALFVRNCRLIFLLRKNFKDGDLNIFSPAEWRWKTPLVCDNDWHHIVLNVDGTGKVDLFIDGIQFENGMENKQSNPEVIDDWPLHAAHGVNTTLTVGACYQSSENSLKHGFIGDISEVKLLLNNNLSLDDIKCDTDCAEFLKVHSSTPYDYYSQVQSNAQMNEIYVESQNKNQVEHILQNIQYSNTKKNPTIGRRNVEIFTKLVCKNRTTVKIPTVETYIMINEQNPVLAAEKKLHKPKPVASINTTTDMLMYENHSKQPESTNTDTKTMTVLKRTTLKIAGKSNKLVTYSEIKHGVRIFNDLNITVTEEGKIRESLQNLDMCSVVIFPSLNPDHEEIILEDDSSFSPTLNTKTSINKDGFEMIGNDSITNYLNVLQSLIYSNKKPAYYLNRVFKLSCSKQDDQNNSAEQTLVLTVLHPKQTINTKTNSPMVDIADAAPYNHNREYVSNSPEQYENKMFAHAMMHRNEVQEPTSKLHSIHKGEKSNPILLIVLVGVFVSIVLVAISIVKVKSNVMKYPESHRAGSKVADDALTWDDSALTITINPMQTDMISEESSDSENSDSDEEHSIKEKFHNAVQLEWDNSNIFASTND